MHGKFDIDFVLNQYSNFVLISAPSHDFNCQIFKNKDNEFLNQDLIPLIVNIFICKKDTQLIYANRREGIIMLAAALLIQVLNLQGEIFFLPLKVSRCYFQLIMFYVKIA